MASRRCAVACALLLGAVLVGPPSAGAANIGPRSTGRPTGDACAKPTPLAPSGTQVPSSGGSIWGLALGQVPPITGGDLKIVWRVTGRGPLRVTFTDPRGVRRPLVFGPERHTSSTFRHPGREWGTGFRFDRQGCWTIRLARVGTRGTVRVTVT